MKTGDQVVAVISYDGLVKGKTYTIFNMATMACGCVLVDVGIETPVCFLFVVYCPQHNMSYDEYNGLRWFGIERFTPIQRKSDEFLSSDKIEKSADERIDIKLPVTA